MPAVVVEAGLAECLLSSRRRAFWVPARGGETGLWLLACSKQGLTGCLRVTYGFAGCLLEVAGLSTCLLAAGLDCGDGPAVMGPSRKDAYAT